MSIHLTDGPTLLQCDFARKDYDNKESGQKLNINISQEIQAEASKELDKGRVIYKIKADENPLFDFEIKYGCKFKLQNFKTQQEATKKMMEKGGAIIQAVLRDFLADLTRRTGRTPLVMPYVDIQGYQNSKNGKKKPPK